MQQIRKPQQQQLQQQKQQQQQQRTYYNAGTDQAQGKSRLDWDTLMFTQARKQSGDI